MPLYFKIIRDNERFWVKFTAVKKNKIHGKIANDTISKKYKFGQSINFKSKDVIEITTKSVK